jgi:xanthine/CO dehydrogenase XdhC/CoxF family maturation factor
MTELEQIAETWTEARSRGESGVLATVVRVHGSSYRRPGARLLLTSGGRRAGSVSGGCLEADLVRKAWWLTDAGKCIVRRYDTTSDGEIAQEFGLGCNGVIHLLLERMDPASISPLNAVEPVRKARRTAVMATVITTSDEAFLKVGQRWLQRPDGEIETDLSDAGLSRQLAYEALSAATDRCPRIFSWESGGHSADIFIELMQPPVRLLVFGGGNDAIPMVRLAKFIGYEAVVLDGRSHLARQDRFPGADGVIVNSESDPLQGVTVDARTVCILMSHSYAQDLAALRALHNTDAAYVGMLGPRKRTQQIIVESGVSLKNEIDGVYSPVGLDIGADGAEQIALAVIAEIQAVMHGRRGGMLRDKVGPMHGSSADTNNETFARPNSCPLDS